MELPEEVLTQFISNKATNVWFDQFQFMQIVATRVGNCLKCVAATSNQRMSEDIPLIRRGQALHLEGNDLGYLMYFLSQQIARGVVPNSKFKDISEKTMNGNILVKTTPTDLYIIGRIHRELSGRDTSSSSSNIRIEFEKPDDLTNFIALIQEHSIPLDIVASATALASLDGINALKNLNNEWPGGDIDIRSTSEVIKRQTQNITLPASTSFSDIQLKALQELHSEQKKALVSVSP